MIFTLYPRVKVKLGDDEEHLFDRSRLMFTEVAEIEKVTGLAFPEWLEQLGEYRITAVAALLHVLRKREGQPSDYGSLQFNVADLDVIPLHDDDREFTPAEVAADLKQRVEEAERERTSGPTSAAAVAAATAVVPEATNGTSRSLPNGSASARGNGSTSHGRTSASARRTSTSS